MYISINLLLKNLISVKLAAEGADLLAEGSRRILPAGEVFKPKDPPGGFVPEDPDDVLSGSQIPLAGSDSLLFALIGNQTLS